MHPTVIARGILLQLRSRFVIDRDHTGWVATLDIDPLRSLTAVAAFSGVRRAAAALHLSQSAVSGHIRRLEREVGCALVIRQGRGITLTSDGEELAGRARAILEQHDAAVHALLPVGDTELLVAATEHAAEFLVPVAVSALNRLLPEYSVRLRLTRSAHVRDLVGEERADVALFLGHPVPQGIAVADLPVEWVGLPGAPTDRLVLFSPPCAVRHRATATLQGRSYTVARECSDLSTVLGTTRSGAGVTPLPRVGPMPDGLQAIPQMPHIPDLPLYVSLGPRIGTAARRSLVTLIRQTLRA